MVNKIFLSLLFCDNILNIVSKYRSFSYGKISLFVSASSRLTIDVINISEEDVLLLTFGAVGSIENGGISFSSIKTFFKRETN
jgi:hypothetical protein